MTSPQLSRSGMTVGTIKELLMTEPRLKANVKRPLILQPDTLHIQRNATHYPDTHHLVP